MARTTLTKTAAPGGYSSTGAVVAMTAADITNKNQFVATGGDLVIAQNSGASPYTVTITSVADPYGRTKDVTAFSLNAGEIAVFGPFPALGWQQTDGKIYLEANNAAVKFGVVALP